MAFASAALMFDATLANAVYCTLGLLAAWPLAGHALVHELLFDTFGDDARVPVRRSAPGR